MKYRLVALDLDGTLLDSRLQIRPQTIETLQRVRETGVQVMIVTGRHHTAVYPYWHQLNLELPAICCNGTYVYDFRAHCALVSNPMTLTESQRLLALAREHAIHIMIYFDDVMAYENDSPHIDKLLEWSATLPEAVRPRIERVASFDKTIEKAQMLWKFLAFGEDVAALHAFDDEVSRSLDLSCVWSAKNRIDIARGGNNKGHRLGEFIGQLGILPCEVIAFGDQDNDKEMLKLAGLGVAMGNSREDVREHADCVTGSNNSDGIAEVLQRLILTSM